MTRTSFDHHADTCSKRHSRSFVNSENLDFFLCCRAHVLWVWATLVFMQLAAQLILTAVTGRPDRDIVAIMVCGLIILLPTWATGTDENPEKDSRDPSKEAHRHD